MTVQQLIDKLRAFSPDTDVELSYREAGYYPDDSTDVHNKVSDVHLNQARGTVVIE